jgi:hypothetical protein
MTTNVLARTSGRPDALSPRVLGTIGMLASPMLLVQGLGAPPQESSGPVGSLIGAVGLVYLVGWACSLVGMRQLGVMGDTAGARATYAVQLTLVLIATVFSVQETVYGSPERVPFPILDLAWPLGHTFMLVTGAFVLKAGVWTGWRRFVPLVCGLKIPLLIALVAAGLPAPVTAGGRGAAGYIQVAFAAVAFLLLGYAVRTGVATGVRARAVR